VFVGSGSSKASSQDAAAKGRECRSRIPWERRRWCWEQGLPLAQSCGELGTARAQGWLDASYRCEGGSGPTTSQGLFVYTLTKGKKSPGEELRGEGIGWVLFPEGLEQLQEAPSAPPGKSDITRFVLGVAVSPPPLPGCLVRFPKPSAPLPCSVPTRMSPPGRAALSWHCRGHGADPSRDRDTCQGCTAGCWDGSRAEQGGPKGPLPPSAW